MASPGGEAGLPKQRRLLISRRPGDADAVSEMHGIGPLIKAAGGPRLRQHAPGNVQLCQDLLVPLEGVDVEHHGAAGVGVIRHMDLAAGQLPDEPRLHRSEQQLPRLRLLPGTGHIVQDPFQLGGREIGVDDQTRLFPEFLGQPPGLQLIAVGAGAAALPDDGMVNGLPRVPVPHDGGLALVGDADRRDVRCAGTYLIHGGKRHAQLGGPDLVGIVLHPAGFREILSKLLLRHTAHFPFFVEKDAAVRCGPGIQRHDV